MNLQENTLFDLGVKVTQNVAQYPLNSVTYAATKFEVATSNGLGGDTFTRNVMDTDDGPTLVQNEYALLFNDKTDYHNIVFMSNVLCI